MPYKKIDPNEEDFYSFLQDMGADPFGPHSMKETADRVDDMIRALLIPEEPARPVMRPVTDRDVNKARAILRTTGIEARVTRDKDHGIKDAHGPVHRLIIEFSARRTPEEAAALLCAPLGAMGVKIHARGSSAPSFCHYYEIESEEANREKCARLMGSI